MVANTFAVGGPTLSAFISAPTSHPFPAIPCVEFVYPPGGMSKTVFEVDTYLIAYVVDAVHSTASSFRSPLMVNLKQTYITCTRAYETDIHEIGST